MNYIKQINAFYMELEVNPLSGPAISLWHSLMHINNRSRWIETFSVAMITLRMKSGLTTSTFKRARAELAAKGYIHVQNQGGNQSPIYRVTNLTGPIDTNSAQTATTIEDPQPEPDQKAISLNDKTDHNLDHKQDNLNIMDHNLVRNPDQSMDQNIDSNPFLDHNMTHNTIHNINHNPAPLIKQKEKQKKKHHNTADAFVFYQENFGLTSPYVSDAIQNWVHDIGDALVVEAMKRALERNKMNWNYVKGILQDWARKGITSVDEAGAEEVAYRNQYYPKQPNRDEQKRTEVLPDWFLERQHKHQERMAAQQSPIRPKMDQAALEAEREELAKLLAEFSSETSEA
ncbi:DnaD domain-containing protein [Oceanobacillus halotolerans]|uniref:DnaD domain-containing protein n=1 Tax=Oceanobacillus halotolerans TaxID=2663380 RepID=UPI0013DC7DF3|nr:DnaD domain protein [Oceanobacillus halotolerans]